MDEDNSKLDGTDLGGDSMSGNPTLENKPRDIANSIIDLTVNTVVNDCAEKVAAEDFDGMVEKADTSDDDLMDCGGAVDNPELQQGAAGLPQGGEQVARRGLQLAVSGTAGRTKVRGVTLSCCCT
jgi:hypothetical protein